MFIEHPLGGSQAGIKTGGRNVNNLRYADDTALMAEIRKAEAKMAALAAPRLLHPILAVRSGVGAAIEKKKKRNQRGPKQPLDEGERGE